MNYFIVVTKTVNGKFDFVMMDDRLPIFKTHEDAKKFASKHGRDWPVKIKHVVRRINKNDLHNLIK